MFELGDISAEAFHAEYWRKKPLHLPGGAVHLLDRTVDLAEFRIMCDRLERTHPHAVSRRKGCIFAQNLDVGSADLRRVTAKHQAATSVRRIWFDGVYATSDEGIGCHYDHSDNFVLQQSGTKHWRLCSPDVLSVAELRARMLDHPGAGLVHMPDECHTFVLEPGDLLYIPLFWGHWGVSKGTSMSLSVVLNADNALDLMLPSLKDALDEEKAWWQPLPQVHNPRTIPPAVDVYFEGLLSALNTDRFRRRAKQVWWERVYLGQTPPEPAADTPYSRQRAVVTLSDAGLDPALVDGLRNYDLEPPKPEASHFELMKFVARRVLSDLFDIALSARSLFIEQRVTRRIVEIARVLMHADLPRVSRLLARPEITSWVWRMREAIDFLQPSYFEEIAHPAPRLFLPAMLSIPAQLRGRTVLVGRSDERGINLLALSRRLRSPVPLATRMEIHFAGPMMRISSAAGLLVEFPQAAFFESGSVDVGSGFFLEDLPALDGITLLERDGWVERQYPGGGRFGAQPLVVGGDVRTPLSRVLKDLDEVWPEIKPEVARTLCVALSVAHGVQTVPPFVGAVALGPNATAADFIDCFGRTKARLVTELALTDLSAPARKRFRRAVGSAYRLAFDKRAGRSPSLEVDRLDGLLTDWGRAFLAASP